MFCLKPKYILFLSKTNEKFNKKIFFFIEKKASKLKLVSSNKNEKKLPISLVLYSKFYSEKK